MHKSNINYNQLLEIISWGIFSMRMKGNSVFDIRLKKIQKINGADYGGIYVGSPGRDIYHMLPYLDNEQMEKVAGLLCEKFPTIPPHSYANVAACIRFIYGQFEKQGILRSEKDFKRMKKGELEWSLSRKFLKFLENEFEKINNYYGMSMLYEMEGHRLGDEAVINKDIKKLEEMEKKYNKCVEYANKCKSYKHMFSIYYWAGEYFNKFGKTNKAIEYYKLSIINASKYYCKYFPNGEKYYSERFLNSLKYIKVNDKKNWFYFKKKYNSIKNKFKNS